MPTVRYRYRFYPNAEQRQMLARQFGCVRYVYNWALAMKQDAFRERGEKIGYAETDRRLTQLKREPDHAWLREVSSVPLQQALRHLDKAYTAFFKGASRFPRFKAKKHRQSATYTRRGFSLKDSGVPGQPIVTLARMSTPLKIRWSRPLPSDPSSLTVVQEPDGTYYISFVVEVEHKPLPRTKREGGIDLGVKDVVVTSDGWRSGNKGRVTRPKHLKRAPSPCPRAAKARSQTEGIRQLAQAAPEGGKAAREGQQPAAGFPAPAFDAARAAVRRDLH
ncbi:transposase [Rhodocaloribacter litoris]|nr:transposase [Rhodocaloribacter litoris]QXD14888.1 transposase [Rhodocaloribacter litoris]